MFSNFEKKKLQFILFEEINEFHSLINDATKAFCLSSMTNSDENLLLMFPFSILFRTTQTKN